MGNARKPKPTNNSERSQQPFLKPLPWLKGILTPNSNGVWFFMDSQPQPGWFGLPPEEVQLPWITPCGWLLQQLSGRGIKGSSRGG